MQARRDFAPGLVLDARKRSTMCERIVAAPEPAQVFVLLDRGDGRRGTPCVREGERVRQGAAIARADDEPGADLHAPVAGRIRSIGPHENLREAGPGIVIDNDGSDERDPRCEPCPDADSLGPEELTHGRPTVEVHHTLPERPRQQVVTERRRFAVGQHNERIVASVVQQAADLER